MKAQAVGRIILEGEDVDPMKLLDANGAVLIEVVDGQYRVEVLPEDQT